jgi:hypothetical protein
MRTIQRIIQFKRFTAHRKQRYEVHEDSRGYHEIILQSEEREWNQWRSKEKLDASTGNVTYSVMTSLQKKKACNVPNYTVISFRFKYSHQQYIRKGARGSVVGWGTMLQAGRSPVQIPDEVDFFKLPNLSSRTMALGSTQPLTKMNTRNFPGGKIRPARRADNLATICEPNVWECGSLNLSQPLRASTACTGITLL